MVLASGPGVAVSQLEREASAGPRWLTRTAGAAFAARQRGGQHLHCAYTHMSDHCRRAPPGWCRSVEGAWFAGTSRRLLFTLARFLNDAWDPVLTDVVSRGS